MERHTQNDDEISRKRRARGRIWEMKHIICRSHGPEKTHGRHTWTIRALNLTTGRSFDLSALVKCTTEQFCVGHFHAVVIAKECSM